MTEHVEQGRSPESDVTEIPLAYRLAHLGIDPSAVYPMLTAQQIADTLGIDGNLVRRPLKKYDIETERLFHDHQQAYFDYYPNYTLELIREERSWREWYLTLPERLNANQVAEAVGRSYGWTTKTLAAMYPNTPQQRHGHKSRLYSRISVQKLRDITFATPPDENWPTVPRLVEFTERDRDWVLNRLAQTAIRPETRRQAMTGREFPHYPPDAFDVLEEAMEQRPKPAGDWLTAHAIANILGRSGNWVTKRLEDSYIVTGEPRLDDMGVERIHYPPSTLIALKDELAELQAYELAGEWATISTLGTRIGMHAVTLTKVIHEIEVESEIRLDLKGRPRPHFSPTTQERLAEKAMELYGYPVADGWLTFSVAQKVIGRSAGWIRQQFEEHGVTSETRLDSSRRPAEHYDPDVINMIKKYGDTLNADSMVSVDDIIERTQMSRTWVVDRLKDLSVQPEKRFSKHGKFIDHYPESIIEGLLVL